MTKVGEVINTKSLQQELEHGRQFIRIDDTHRETNPYKDLVSK